MFWNSEKIKELEFQISEMQKTIDSNRARCEHHDEFFLATYKNDRVDSMAKEIESFKKSISYCDKQIDIIVSILNGRINTKTEQDGLE